MTVAKTVTAMALGGALVVAAGFGIAGILTKRQVQYALRHYPYQTVGYTPGYVAGYIPGNLPGYSVPGYIPGYGTFRALSSADFKRERSLWIGAWIRGDFRR